MLDALKRPVSAKVFHVTVGSFSITAMLLSIFSLWNNVNITVWKIFGRKVEFYFIYSNQ
jgi:hypothetical protein